MNTEYRGHVTIIPERTVPINCVPGWVNRFVTDWGGGRSLYVGVAVNILIKQSRTADKGWSCLGDKWRGGG
jgi:hypothetical protein